MDWDLLLEEYYAWVPTVTSIFKVYTGSGVEGTLVPTVADGVDEINAIFAGGASLCSVLKMNNTVSLDGFVMWLKYVKNI